MPLKQKPSDLPHGLQPKMTDAMGLPIRESESSPGGEALSADKDEDDDTLAEDEVEEDEQSWEEMAGLGLSPPSLDSKTPAMRCPGGEGGDFRMALSRLRKRRTTTGDATG